MNSDILIQCEGLGKKFCIDQKKSMLYGGIDVFASMVGFPTRRDTLRKHEIWALRDLNFQVKRGDTLGVIGVNGAGKSTLLRVLSGIYPPDAGSISIKGPVGALISAGAGFHPDMTGRENIYLNGAIVGLRKKEIDRQLEEIIEFAEIGEFIDTPVRFYSTGMYVRLGFSIAVHIRPRILLLDEVLSVGDITFQNKCFRKLKELRESVEAVVFVSHNLDHVRNLCGDLIILDGGKMIYHGEVDGGTVKYQAYADTVKKKSADTETNRRSLAGSFLFDTSEVILERVEIGNGRGPANSEIWPEDDLVIQGRFKVERIVEDPQLSVAVLDDRNNNVIWQINHDQGVQFERLEAGRYEFSVIFKKPPLAPGVYKVNFSLLEASSREILSHHKRFVSFVVRGSSFSRGAICCKSEWSVEKIEGESLSDSRIG